MRAFLSVSSTAYVLDHNRATAQIASRLKVASDAVKNVIIWGNHSSTQFPDVRSATVNVDGKQSTVSDAIRDDHWLQNEFIAVSPAHPERCQRNGSFL